MAKNVRDETGQGLIEIIIALTFIAFAVAAILALMTAGALSLQRASEKGTALTLADAQLETFRTIGFHFIRLDGSAIPGSGAYVTANGADPTIPSSTPMCTTVGAANCLVVGTTSSETPCSSPPPTPVCAIPRQSSVRGPDGRTYEIDTYISYSTPTSATAPGFSETGRPVKNVLIIVRDPATPADPLVARVGSTFDNSSLATG